MTDSGSVGNFIDRVTIHKLLIPLYKLHNLVNISTIDGELVSKGIISNCMLPVQMFPFWSDTTNIPNILACWHFMGTKGNHCMVRLLSDELHATSPGTYVIHFYRKTKNFHFMLQKSLSSQFCK